MIVRTPENHAEVDACFRLAAAAFNPSGASDGYVSWRDEVIAAPDFAVSQIRGVYRDGELVGGCIVNSRRLRVGPARLPAGCIGAVATRAENRKQGVASALLADVLVRARADGVPLLLLDGIADFYHRFGYVDVFDPVWHRLPVQTVASLPPSPYSTRKGTKDDAPRLLDLYDRHYSGYLGSFDRSLDVQRHRLPASPDQHSPLLAVAPDGRVRGYLAQNWSATGQRAAEVAADDWPAALALLHSHVAQVASRPNPPDELLWALPVTSPTFHLLADRLLIRSETTRHPRTGWQGRVAEGGALLRDLLPLFAENWSAARAGWRGVLEIRLGEAGSISLDLQPGTLERAEAGSTPDARVTLPPEAFLKVLFGQRDVAWAARQEGTDAPDTLLPTLARLLAAPPAWIPGTDYF